MNWKKLLSELNEMGMTQAVIAKECGCGQSTISELLRGITISPTFDLGNKLINLHVQKIK